MQRLMRPDLSIIIVATNEFSLLKKCLLSIEKTKEKLHVELFIVNNASTDQTKHYLKKYTRTPYVHILENTTIKGFAYNNNQAITKAQANYIILLNPDTELLPQSLQRMLSFIKLHKAVGICAPKLLNPDMSLQYSCRHFPTWKTYVMRRTPFRYMFPNSTTNNFHLMKNENHDQQQPVDWVLGGCLCIKKEMINSIGILDDKYFLYVDDIDYCLRAWHKHWSVYYLPSAKVIHHHQAKSDKKLFSVYSLYHMKSMIYFVLKHGLSPKRQLRHPLKNWLHLLNIIKKGIRKLL